MQEFIKIPLIFFVRLACRYPYFSIFAGVFRGSPAPSPALGGLSRELGPLCRLSRAGAAVEAALGVPRPALPQ
jgi:hypothetical protein